jgi:hypothetical protein
MAIVEAVARGDEPAGDVKAAAELTEDFYHSAIWGQDFDVDALATTAQAAGAALAASIGDAVGAALQAHGAVQEAALASAVATRHTRELRGLAKDAAAVSAARCASKAAERDLRQLVTIGSEQTTDPSEAGPLGPLNLIG